MNQWNNEDLRRRQHAGDAAFLRIDPPNARQRAKVLIVPGSVVLAGVIMMVLNLLPGLGVFLAIGGMFSVVVTVLIAWLGA